jgi:hypothetical protein
MRQGMFLRSQCSIKQVLCLSRLSSRSRAPRAFQQISAASDIQDCAGQANVELPVRGMYAGRYSEGE